MVTKPIDEIREAYPTPCMKQDDLLMGDQYCVGGAICLAHGFDINTAGRPLHFPDETELAAVLERLNPGIDAIAAFHCAQQIIVANDQGPFDEAWDIAEAALTVV